MKRLKQRLRRLRYPDSKLFMAAFAGLHTVFMLIWIETGLTMFTGLGQLADWIIIIAVAAAGNLLVGAVMFAACCLLVWLPWRVPYYLLGSLAAVLAIFPRLFTFANMDWPGAFLLTGLLALFGMLAGVLLSVLIRPVKQLAPRVLVVAFCATVLLLTSAGYVYYGGLQMDRALPAMSQQIDEADSAVAANHPADGSVDLTAPYTRGPYAVEALTYGSGTDRLRSEYGKQAQWVSRTVDASAFIKDWRALRTLYWGFDESRLPLNGRVWMPVGDGPFPLVMIVHGNHNMEDFSDDGYAYLGELLASRGFITISIDENYANYSMVSGIPDEDYALRAWLIIHHLKQLDDWSNDSEHRLFHQIDWEQLALIGHSRGGQAAVLAARFDDYFSQAGRTDVLTGIQYRIKTIIALAPTDKKLENTYPELENVNYLVIQGAYDSDVSTFDGDRQYDRISFVGKPEDDEFYMKASLYVEQANHGQFNTSWGKHDIKLPLRLLMNTQVLLPAAEQRLIAKAYIAGFLEATLHEQRGYIPMFKDWRVIADQLPATQYLSRYDDSEMLRLADYEEDDNRETATIRRGWLQADGLSEWEEEDKRSRGNGSRQNRALKLSWEERKGRYTVEIPKTIAASLSEPSAFAFSLARDAGDTTNRSPLDFSLRLTTQDGKVYSRPLSEFKPIQPLLISNYLNISLLEPFIRNGKLSLSAETVYQDFFIPLAAFHDGGSPWHVQDIRKIEFVFDQTESGVIWLDDIRLDLR